MSMGDNTFIHKASNILMITEDKGKTFTPHLEIGNDVYIGRFFHLHCMSNIVIGDGCVFSDNVFISGASHGVDPDKGHIMEQQLTYDNIQIGKNTFVGRGVFISPGVTLGKNCVVGANSVVTKSFDSYTMIGGMPARVLKRYDHVKKEWVKAV